MPPHDVISGVKLSGKVTLPPLNTLGRKSSSPDIAPSFSNKRQIKKADKDELKRKMFRTFVKQSQNLRFNDKMKNVIAWKNDQIKFANSSMVKLDSPNHDQPEIESSSRN